MPPIQEPPNIQPKPLSANHSRTALFVGSGILVLLIAGVIFVLWKISLPASDIQSQSTPTVTSTASAWIVCADASCQSTTTVDQNALSAIPAGEYLNTEYIHGTNAIYYWDDHNALGTNTLINLHADSTTFVTFTDINETYGKDKNTVWFGDQVVQGADASTFTANDLYGQDTLHVYYMGDVIPGADPKTFVAIGVNYSKDATHVYFGTSTVQDADPQTIQVIDDYSLAKDKNHVYQHGKIMPGVNPATYIPPPQG